MSSFAGLPVLRGVFLFSAGPLLLGFSFAPSNAQSAPPEIRQELLGEAAGAYETYVSPDYRHVLHLGRNGSMWRVTFDLKEVVTFEAPLSITRTELPFGEHVAFGPGGGQYAFRLRSGATERVYLNGKPGPEHPAKSIRTMEFSKDGSRFGYVVNEAGKGGRTIIDGVEGKTYEGVVSFSISPTGERNALFANAGRQWQLVVDGKAMGTYEGFTLPYKSPSPYFSPDGRRVAVGVARKKKWVALVDGDESREFDLIAEPPRFSPNSRRVAFIGQEGENRVAVVDGVEHAQRGITFANNGDELPFSPDSKRTAFIVRPPRPMGQFVVVDGKKGPEYTEVNGFRFSGDSNHLGYVASRERRHYAVIDGVESEAFDSIDRDSLIFNHDATRWAFVGRRKDEVRVIERGKEGGRYAGIIANPVIGGDGRHLAYLGIRSDAGAPEKAVLVLDGAEVLKCAGFVGSSRSIGRPLSFDTDGNIHCLIVRGEKIYRVRVSPK